MANYDVAEYMVTTLNGKNHPALFGRPGSGIVFDGLKKRWVMEADGADCSLPYDEIYKATFEARDALLATANKYRKKLKQPLITSSTSNDWTEVEASVQDACNGLEGLAAKDKDMSSSLGKLKRGFRSLCRNAGAGQTAANLIPNDSFGLTSLLCGSLKVVFTGLRTTGMYRQEIYRTLEDLPSRLKDLAADIKMNDQDEEVHRRAAALYVAVFKLLEHILHWFLKNTWITGVKLLVDPSGFTDKLRDYQAEVKTASQSFDAQLNKISRATERKSIQLQYCATYGQTNIHTQLQTVIQNQKSIHERMARIGVLEQLNPLLNHVMDALQQRVNTDQKTLVTKLLPDIDPDYFLSHFLYEPDLLLDDCAALCKRADRSRRSSHDASRVIALQSNPRLRAWLTVDEPSLLILNGRAEPHLDSAVSLFTAKMLEHLMDHYRTSSERRDCGTAIIPLGFFCGQHRDWHTDENATPEEVAMSLLLQLVDRGRKRLEPRVLRECYEQMKPGNIESICSMLEALILSLGPDVVLIVVVDGLRFFAHPYQRLHGLRELLSRLVGIYRGAPAATLKMLFASPTRSDFVEESFADEEVLQMPRDIPSTYQKSPARSRMQVDEAFRCGSPEDCRSL